jgi:hypothetical protein
LIQLLTVNKGQLQQKCAALEKAQATLKLRDMEITRLAGS